MEVGFNPFPGSVANNGAGFGNQQLGRFEFLRLLVAQLSNQNPLEPVENTEFVAQVAQFSSLDELVKIRELTETSLAIMADLILSAPPEDPAAGEEIADPAPVENPAA